MRLLVLLAALAVLQETVVAVAVVLQEAVVAAAADAPAPVSVAVAVLLQGLAQGWRGQAPQVAGECPRRRSLASGSVQMARAGQCGAGVRRLLLLAWALQPLGLLLVCKWELEGQSSRAGLQLQEWGSLTVNQRRATSRCRMLHCSLVLVWSNC